jgi:sugar porter (SP) family MFS transporter
MEDVYTGTGVEPPSKTHEGEFHNDVHTTPIPITRATKIYALCAAVNSCNLGYDIGVNTNAGWRVQQDFDLTDNQRELFVGSINFWSMFGALGAHWICDRYGRRLSFIVAAASFILGIIIMACAWSYPVIMFGRVFVGLGVGFGLAIDPLYISEMSPAAHRGELVTWSEMAINVGIVLGFAAGLIQGTNSWRYMFLLGGILPICMIFLVVFIMPETPRWLITKNRDHDAKGILTQLYPEGFNVDSVIADIKESIERDTAAEHSFGWDIVFKPTPAFRRIMVVGVGMAVSQQAVGIDAIQYFLIDILDKSGVTGQLQQTLILIFLGIVKLAFIVVGGKLFDRKGRRPLFFTSLVGMFIALMMVAFNFLGESSNSGFSVFALALYLAMFSIGIGPGAWLVPAEVFPTCIRAKAMSVATFSNRLTATIMASTFLSTANAISYAGFFFLLSAICVVCFAFLYIFLPETKGRSLEDMSLYFAEITGDRSVLEAEQQIQRGLRQGGGGGDGGGIQMGSSTTAGTRPLTGVEESEII